MTKEAKPGGPVPPRVAEALLEEVRGPRKRKEHRVWTRITEETGVQVAQVGLHMTLVHRRPMREADTLQALLDLGLEAYRAKYPNMDKEISPP